MSAPKVRCPACSAVISTGRGSDGRYWCTACDEVFEVHELPEDESPPRARARPEVRSRAPRRAPERPSNRLVVVLALAFGVIGLVGMGVAGYFALRKEEPPKEAVAADPPKKGEPPRVVPPPAPAKEPPEKAAPSKKDEPNPPTRGIRSRTPPDMTVPSAARGGEGTAPGGGA
ncbi:MAG: hypothetical protein J0I06_01385, partial [Planctomycetes bacterium]|nr:hypothetical protein [Planctomycetota bacterium]